ncbi:MAG TPA: hypothetical protein VJ843_04075 [Candidatus Saccharimonadales bacterium]|nr:hypothetical protein [Candidatus Saccharimonadales bacterium]
MKSVVSQVKNIMQQRSVIVFAIVAVLTTFSLTFQKPMEAVASTNPGLDSGNAQVTTVGGDTVLQYKTTGTSTFKAPGGVSNVRVMVIGGGGAGGTDNAGGGGAGGFIENASYAVTPGTAVTVTTGTGGTAPAAPGSGKGGNGGNSVFGTLTAVGGGGGGFHGGGTGNNGGSGGGAAGNAAASGGTGTAGQGTNGGGKPATTEGRNGGGGGATAAGADATTSAPGAGGAGKSSNITGSSVTYAGGGGGAGRNDSGNTVAGGVGGSGGGGQGAGSNGVAAAGATNTGSGGGGGANNPSNASDPVRSGASGGSGIVIVRFTTQNGPDPAGVSGVAMWYKADSAGNTNAQWNDFSGAARNLTQGTTGNQPALTANQINFNPAYVFNGTSSVFNMANQGIGATDSLTAYFSALATRSDGGYRYFTQFGADYPSLTLNNGKPDLYVRGTNPQQYTYSTNQAGAPHIFSFVSPNANNQTRSVGVDDQAETQTVTSGTYTTNSGNTNTTFGGGVNSFAGPIGEAIYFNRTLTAQEQLRVFSYLAIKWGITRYQGTNSGSYLDSAATTIWNKDTTFANRIAGIGRDDTSTLNQKQSVGSSDVTIGRGAIAADNAANSNTFANDKSFLLWGDDNGSTSTTSTVTGAYTRISRTWKAVSTNTPGQVQISIPKTLIAATGGNGAELYTNTTNTFDASATRTAMTASGNNYVATVTLPAGTSYFTFGSLAGSDLQFVSKTATTPSGTAITSYTPGEALQYQLVVKNNGPSDAGLVTVTDTLPTGVVPKAGGATGTGWTCNVSGQTVTCTRTALANGNTAPTITVEANIASNVTGAKNNTASVSVANDPDLSNNSASLNLPAAPKADLSITKAHNGTLTAGSTENYDFVVKNNGPSDVSSFTVTDTLDSNLSYASVTGTGVSCGAVSQVVTCTGPALTSGSTSSFTITVNVSGAYAGGTVTNTGTVAVPSGVTDPNSANNSSTDSSNVVVSTELSVAKTHTGNFTAGTNGTFTIVVNNAGPSTTVANGVTVTDTLDPDFSYVSAAGTNWTCSNSGDTVTCNYGGTIAAGNSSTPITLTVLVDSIASGSVSNTAEESSTTPDPTSNSTSTDTVTVDADADLALTKSHVGSGFVAGQQEQYAFSVTNNGPSADSPSYTITDTLPAGVTFVGTVAGSAASCSAVGQVVTCTGGAIGAGDPAQVTTIDVAISGSASGTINNSATVATAAGITDSNSANNTGNDSASVEPNADLSISKTHTGNITAGSNATYDIVVSNAGPSNVSSFTVTDTLDNNFTYVSATGATCNAVGQVVTCTGGAITSGNQATITLTVSVEPSATGNLDNTATVAAPTGVNDPDTSNNSSTATNTVVASADLSISKTHTGNFKAGNNGVFTITATNNGPSDASTATITDTLPAGLTYVSATSTDTDVVCSDSGQTVTCTTGPTMANAATVPITLTVLVDPTFTGSTIDNTASVASATTDPTPANNSDTDTVNFDQAQADVEITKALQGTITAGEDATYKLSATNNGPDNAGNMQITDNLPTYMTYKGFTSLTGSWSCSAAGQTVTCTISDLANGATDEVDIDVAVGADAPNPAVNSATVNFNGTNTATTTTASTSDPVDYSADLSIDITHEEKTYREGDHITYTYTLTNHGPSVATDAVMTSQLPEGLKVDNVSGTEPGGSSILAKLNNAIFPRAMAATNPFGCTLSGTTLTCNAATFPVTSYQIFLTGTINKTGNLVTTASITSATPDPNPNDTTATDTVVGVLAGAGGGSLTNTGQKTALIAGGATALIVAALWIRRLRRRAHAM